VLVRAENDLRVLFPFALCIGSGLERPSSATPLPGGRQQMRSARIDIFGPDSRITLPNKIAAGDTPSTTITAGGHPRAARSHLLRSPPVTTRIPV